MVYQKILNMTLAQKMETLEYSSKIILSMVIIGKNLRDTDHKPNHSSGL